MGKAIKTIQIEFDGPDKDGLNDMQVQELNEVLDRAIDRMLDYASVKKVTVDGNVYYLRSTNGREETAETD